MDSGKSPLTSIEICAGAGGQALGLHAAGFRHLALVEIDKHAAATLRENIGRHPDWSWEKEHCLIHEGDVKEFKPAQQVYAAEAPGLSLRVPEAKYPMLKRKELDLLAGGVPCPPFSAAGHQLGRDDERDLFPKMLDLVAELKPRAVMIENVRGLVEPEDKFRYYRNHIKNRLRKEEYVICGWNLLHAEDFGVPQLRPRAILVAIRKDEYRGFDWPAKGEQLRTVQAELKDSMEDRFGADTKRFEAWYEQAGMGTVAPTLVGGSKKHGGADLGPTRAKRAWERLGVNAMGVANDPDKMVDPKRDLGDPGKSDGARWPMLTVEQAALIQGFPDRANWDFTGGKTARYRQVGNAFPPRVAEAVGRSIREALERTGPLHKDPSPDYEPEADPSAVAPQLPLGE
ncbi:MULTISPECIES: DNA (cytosine-5-)-methyltransferase [unclassified Streptomyces]|uniref:DNA cytosine methyltransferase n=1 Tax=unclassified Streptomyces TaxID=2593676 RepID=UPI000DB9196F|nr:MULTISPECIES: DNA (cytosine-5-)-methyltransferase [unclassified Streptomyces]MYT71534.1 DNA (cytosine-5-)-methyltransferase [Streptomyces sp. SID8367]RAJ82997.1 DNA (cytosine-5)-methyltransferase 1 [Streptomyces sp. PsTaAH-137]